MRGLAKNTAFDSLKVNLLAGRGEHFHVDTLDLYGARQRAIFLKQAATELGVAEDVIKADLGKVLAEAGTTARPADSSGAGAEGYDGAG